MSSYFGIMNTQSERTFFMEVSDMKKITEQLRELAEVCDSDERELIEQMVHSAADYVRQVVVMESTAMNLAGRDAENFRRQRLNTDEARSLIHNGFIADVVVVNRLCQNHGMQPIYTGQDHRRCFGDFAIRLVDEIFNDRS